MKSMKRMKRERDACRVNEATQCRVQAVAGPAEYRGRRLAVGDVPADYAYAFDVKHRDGRTVVHAIAPDDACLLRFVNAPPRGRRPNCAFEQAFGRGDGRILLRALVDLAPGDELLASYGRHTGALMRLGRGTSRA